MKPENNTHPSRYEFVTSDRQLADKVTYRESEPGELGPVEKAEQQIELISSDFGQWLNDDFIELQTAWRTLKKDHHASDAFLRFHRAIHTLSGNAAMLDCATASQLAAPIARLIDRTPAIDDHIQLINSSLQAIATAISGRSDVDESINKVHEGIETIVDRWISKQSQATLRRR